MCFIGKHVKRHLTRVEDEGIFFRDPKETIQMKKLLFATHLKLLIVQHTETRRGGKTQQTSGITKTKLKFFIDNKRRVEKNEARDEFDSVAIY
jgi:hypothetical protein